MGANLSGTATVFGLYSSLVTLAFSSVAWPSGVGVAVGFLVGLGLALVLIDRTLRAHGRTPQAGLVRGLASLCCLVWGLVLPVSLALTGLIWGAGYGVGTLIEGPVSTTVRQTTHVWLTGANGLSSTVLKRLPLAKRLTEHELLTVVQAAPEWISEALDQEKIEAAWQKATGAAMPAQLAQVLRHEFRAVTEHHGEWLRPVTERLRDRAQVAAGTGPTVQEAIEATVAPAVFHDISASIRATTRRDARMLALFALLLSALLAGLLRLAWKQPTPLPDLAPARAPARDGAGG